MDYSYLFDLEITLETRMGQLRFAARKLELIASKIQEATPKEIESTRKDLREVNNVIMDILIKETNYTNIFDKWNIPDIPVLKMKTLEKNGKTAIRDFSLQHATFAYLNSMTVLSEAKLENLDAATEKTGVITKERAHFFIINENFFNSFDEAIDTAHNIVEEETDLHTEKIKKNSRVLQLVLLGFLIAHMLLVIFLSINMHFKIENDQLILLTLTTEDL